MKKTSEKLEWRVHVQALFKEISNNPQCSQIIIPLKILKNLLIQVAKRAIELNDLQLNQLMMRMALYEISDPTTKGYNYKKMNAYLKLKERK